MDGDHLVRDDAIPVAGPPFVAWLERTGAELGCDGRVESLHRAVPGAALREVSRGATSNDVILRSGGLRSRARRTRTVSPELVKLIGEMDEGVAGAEMTWPHPV